MKKQFLLFSFMLAMVSNVIAARVAFNEHTVFNITNEDTKEAQKAQWSFVEKKFITDISTAKQKLSGSPLSPVHPICPVTSSAFWMRLRYSPHS